MGSEVIYLLVGIFSTMWLESLMIEQDYVDEWGLGFSFGDRIRSIFLWPIFTLPYLIEFIVVFIKALFEDDQQQT